MLENLQSALNSLHDIWLYEVCLMAIFSILMASGVGRLRSSFGKKWVAISFCLISYFACTAISVGHTWMSRYLSVRHIQLTQTSTLSPFCKDWGEKFTPQKRSEYSQMLSRQAFLSSGAFREYFDLKGRLVEFSPSDADRKYRADMLKIQDQLAATIDLLFWAAISWLFIPLLGIAVGVSGLKFFEQTPLLRK